MKKEKPEIKNLGFHLENLEKEKQNKLKINGWKLKVIIRMGISGIETIMKNQLKLIVDSLEISTVLTNL